MATRSIALLGVPVDGVTMQDTIDRVESFVLQGGFHQVATANADYLTRALEDAELREILASCDLVVADGMPLVWASRILGAPLPERVTGADLVPQLLALSARKGYRVFLFGGTEEANARAIANAEAQYPGLCFAGSLAPEIKPLEEFDNDSILAAIDAAKPDILLVALGNPKQEKWIHRNRHRLNVPVSIGVGGTVDFLAGRLPRAPRWMQAAGAEWVYRLVQEPRRLAGRYSRDAWALLRYLSRQLILSTLQMGARRAGAARMESVGAIPVVHLEGRIEGEPVAQLDVVLSLARGAARPVILDLSLLGSLGPDALASLLRFGRKVNEAGCEVWLAGATASHLQLLGAANVKWIFREAATLDAALRAVAPQRLQLTVEAGDGWAVCRVAGQLGAGEEALLEDLCRRIMQTHPHFSVESQAVRQAARAATAA
jgi:N-acetylglucosaminyldiphosphoundecaprenol N-acetyl-beta-D-mannosaminyltransferase